MQSGAIVPLPETGAALAALRHHPLGKEAAIIGEVMTEHPGFVVRQTRVGGTRVVDLLSGEQLPRICEARNRIAPTGRPSTKRSGSDRVS
jgi:hydrogenase maturation factor